MKKIALLLVFALGVTLTYAQNEEPKPEKYENVTWHEIVYVDYKPGKYKRAMEIIDMYAKAGAEVGLQGPQRHTLMTGEYDVVMIWEMKGGPSDLEWKRSPENIKWWDAFIKVAGSKEEANKLRDEYRDLISKAKSEISMMEK